MPKRFLLALIGGGISYFAYPSPAFWPTIFVSVAAIYLAIRDLGFWSAILVGAVGGIAFYVAQIYWISQYLGPVPLIALAGLEACIFAVGSAITAMLTKQLKNTMLLAATAAIVWTGREWVATHFPYGGFPWSRLAMSQSNSPLSHWVAIGGFGLLSAVIVFATVLAVEIFLTKRSTKNTWTSAVTWLLLFAIPLVIAAFPASKTGSIRVAGIQGNAKAGLFAETVRGTILQNHLDVTYKLLQSGASFDLVVWPENASDLSPDDDADAAQILSELVNEKLGKPLIFGAITSSGEEVFNSSKIWLPDRGEVDQYDKKRPVPFGEYVPDRDFFYALAPDLVGLISRGYSFGTRDPIFEVGGNKLGILICFEEAIDELPRDAVNAGATILIAQTNNADFGKSDESVQQLAIARLRAIETGRAIVNVSTVGPSAFIDADGSILSATKAYSPEFIVADVPKYEQKTLAIMGGWLVDPLAAAVSGILWIWLVINSRRRSTKL